nr:TetR/AcrR family transcriptional regulator [Candidatus Gracilibacteria bacterium]
MEKIEILEKLEPLFYEKPFKNVSMQEIADILKVKKASLYYYFPSKNILLEEIINYSFENYLIFIEDILKKELKKFINDFIKFPKKSKNIFSIINQNGYCEDDELKQNIQNKQKLIFDKISKELEKKYNFSKEKTFLFISMLEDLSRKKCIFGNCPFDLDKLIDEIRKIVK